MDLTISVPARTGMARVGAGPGSTVLSTLLVMLAGAVAIAGVIDAAMRPDGIRGASAALTVAWAVSAVVYRRSDRAGLAAAVALVALAQAVASAWFVAAPIALAAWLVLGLSLPDLRLGTPTRRVTAVAAGVGALGWTGWLVTTGQSTSTAALTLATIGAAGTGLVAVAVRCRRATPEQRQFIQWLAAAAVTIAAADVVLIALSVLLGVPAELTPWVLGTLVFVPLGVLGGQLRRSAAAGESVLIEAIVVAGLAAFVVAVYLVVVVGLVRPPAGAERDILLSSVAAALVIAVLALPIRARLVAVGHSIVGRAGQPASNVLGSFSARMSRAVPMDELLLQLAESLQATLGSAGAEVWVGSEGVLTRTVSVPHRSSRRVELGAEEQIVVGRARIGGRRWASVWLPQLLNEDGAGGGPGERAAELIRMAPAAHLGHLHGLLLVRRPAGSAAFSDDEDTVLVELARQVALALHNVRLDSALQASLEEVQQRNAELQASRLRIVTAADESRRTIERNLHDGAQQHLVALAVKLGLARQLVDSDPAVAAGQLEELRTDVQSTITAVRELAHGIYPPLLRQRGSVRHCGPRPPGRRCRARSTWTCLGATPSRWRRRSTSAAWRRSRTPASTPARARRSPCGWTWTERGCTSRSPTTARVSPPGRTWGRTGTGSSTCSTGWVPSADRWPSSPYRATAQPFAAASRPARSAVAREPARVRHGGRLRCGRRRLRSERAGGGGAAGRGGSQDAAGGGGRHPRRRAAHPGADAARVPPRRVRERAAVDAGLACVPVAARRQ